MLISVVRKNDFIKDILKKISINHPLLTGKLLDIYRNNIPIEIIEENIARLADEEINCLSTETLAVYEGFTKKNDKDTFI